MTATHSHAYSRTLIIPATHPQSCLYQTPHQAPKHSFSQHLNTASHCFPCSTKEGENRGLVSMERGTLFPGPL